MKKCLLLALLACFFEVGAREFQLWTANVFKKEHAKDWESLFEFSTRTRESPFRTYYYHWEYELKKHLGCGWSLIPGYRHEYNRHPAKGWKNGAVPLLAVTKKQKFSDVSVHHRSRIEYHYRGSEWRFRQRITCKMNFTFWAQPFFAEEVFFAERRGFNQNRFSIGLKKKLCSKGHFEIAYMLRDRKIRHRWRGENDLVLKASMKW